MGTEGKEWSACLLFKHHTFTHTCTHTRTLRTRTHSFSFPPTSLFSPRLSFSPPPATLHRLSPRPLRPPSPPSVFYRSVYPKANFSFSRMTAAMAIPATMATAVAAEAVGGEAGVVGGVRLWCPRGLFSVDVGRSLGRLLKKR
jgi:hypothetical protein